MGLGSAYREGFAAGLARGYDVFVEIDADLSHDPADIPRLLRAIDHGADLAIGSRYVAGGSVPHWHRVRLLLLEGRQPLRRRGPSASRCATRPPDTARTAPTRSAGSPTPTRARPDTASTSR